MTTLIYPGKILLGVMLRDENTFVNHWGLRLPIPQNFLLMMDATGQLYYSRALPPDPNSEPVKAVSPPGAQIQPGGTLLGSLAGLMEYYWAGSDGLQRIRSENDGATWLLIGKDGHPI